MKKFQFRLQSVDRVRKIALDQQRKVFFEATEVVRKLDEEKDHMLRNLEAEVKRQRAASQLKDLPEISRNYKEVLRQKIAQKEKEILTAKHEVFKQRNIMNDRLKDKKIMEKLRDNEKEKYDAELEKLLSQSMDEVGIRLWIHRRRLQD
jgi:flagellar FliJ protein